MRQWIGRLALLAIGVGCAPNDDLRRGSPDDGSGPTVDAAIDAGDLRDAGIDAGSDAGTPEDAGVDLSAPADAGAPGAYLDRCNVDGDCASGSCLEDIGPSRFCSRSCVVDGECASDHLCASGLCVPNDVGALCDESDDCATSLCAGNPTTGVGECTRTCANASECPSGFACADAGGAFVCVDIGARLHELLDRGLSRGPGSGHARMHRRLPGARRLPPDPARAGSTPAPAAGAFPSDLVLGPDPLGNDCRFDGDANLCRSGVCLDDDFGNRRCTQVCSERSTCGEGFACVPTGRPAPAAPSACVSQPGIPT